MAMPQPAANKATICIVNYKTIDFTRLCLRSIRKFTNYPYEVIVVDNDSNDESVEYLRSLKWIRLVERPHQPGQPRGSYDEAAAFDSGLANCNTEFYVVMHSDTFVKKTGWLTELISCFRNDQKIACVGSGKIESTPRWLALLKKLTDIKALNRALFGSPAQRARFRYHNRTICCLYRTEVLRREGLSFLMGDDEGLTSGQKLYFELVDRGYKTVELPPSVMGRYVIHLTHATPLVNPQEFELTTRTIRKRSRKIDKMMSSDMIKSIINDDSLDH
jgi:cellulose synthase/poly-beta-1,6-N-acetylglucosamine synthase-like glycosyltransferase